MDYKMYYLARRNPSVSPEDWPKHWRSHPKFVSQFPMIGGRIEKIFYNARIYCPTLDGSPVELPQVSTEYDGVAVVSSPRDTLAIHDTPGDIHDKIMEDDRRVFGDYTRNSGSMGKEVLVLGGQQGKASVIRFVRRRPGTSPDQFRAAWGKLADIAEQAVKDDRIVRYVHAEQSEPRRPGHEYDGISEAWFASPEDAIRALSDPALASLFDAEGIFSDPAASVTMLNETIYAWPRV